MAAFSDVTLSFNGRDYVIPADKVMGAIARVEDVITLGEVAEMASQPKSGLKLTRLASAFGVVLRYAGADVTDEDVYAGMFAQNGPQHRAPMEALMALLGLMVPNEAFLAASAGEPPPGKAKPVAGASSRKLSK